MGSESSHSDGQTFQIRDWELTETHENYSIWRNRSDPSQSIIEHTIYSSSNAEESEQRQMFILRKNHPSLVAARYLQNETSGQFCSSSHVQKLFIEKIPIRLSDVEHVPLPDLLHMYSQSLKGFQQLSRHVGCFPIEEEYIGINQNGVVKIWMNQNYFKDYFSGGKISEEYMVKNLIELLQKKIDHDQLSREIPSVRNYLYRNTDNLRFQDAIKEFNELVRIYFNGQVPSRLLCIERVGKSDALIHQLKLTTSEKNQHSYITQSPYLSSQEWQISHSAHGNKRPHLVDSQFIKHKFKKSAPRIQTSPIYYQVNSGGWTGVNSSQFIPNIQSNILTPSRVRQNTPIIRKITSIYNSTNKLPVSNFATFEKQNIKTQNPVSFQMQSQRTEKINNKPNQIPESKQFAAKSLIYPINQQQKVIPPFQKTTLTYNNRFQAQKTSLIQLIEPQTPEYNQQGAKRLNFSSNNYPFLEIKVPSQIVKTVQPVQFVQKKPFQAVFNPNSPRSFLFQRPSSKSFAERTQKRLNSYVLSSGQFDNLQSSNNNNVFKLQNNEDKINNHQQIIRQEVVRTSEQSSFRFKTETNSKHSQKDQENISKGVRVDHLNLPKTSNIKASQYTTVDIDDGKSSQDFLKKLKQFSIFDPKLNSQSQQSLPTYKNSFFTQERFNFPSQTQNTLGKPSITKEANSLQNSNHSQQVCSAEQFGKNAVSNIILNQSGITTNKQKNTTNTPLKFQKNLDMKYSIFEPDEDPSPTYAKKYSYTAYEPKYDAEILADMNKLKS